MKKYFLFFTISVFCISAFAQNVNIIPLPASANVESGNFTFTKTTCIIYDRKNDALQTGLYPLLYKLKQAAGIDIAKNKKTTSSSIEVLLDNTISGDEAYELYVAQNKISIKAKTPAGIFYAVQSLLQLLPPSIEATSLQKNIDWSVQCIAIKDAPRFSYRGIMLDVARHYMPVEFLQKLIDLMAMQKMNRFHLHLTDSQGWRFESKKYPKLTKIGAYRKGTPLNTTYNYNSRPNDTLYGGYYTQQQLRGLVKYAAERFITIIPEIEMPAHSMSALAAYPELACVDSSGKPFPYPQQIQNEYCTKDETFNFLDDILSEVMEVFPSKYIHVAGDEAGKETWKKCPYDIKRMKEEGLSNVEELQSYFIRRIEKFVNSKGRSIIGWDEILQGGLAPNATVMSWTGIEGGIKAAQQHHNVIMTPGGYCYLDHYQSDAPGEPSAFGGLTTLAKTYSYNPVPDELTNEQSAYIQGTQGNLWTEYVPTTSKAEYMIFPRAIALAEVGWTPYQHKNYENFTSRLTSYLKRLDIHHVNYSKHLFEIKLATTSSAPGEVTASLSGVAKEYKMYYTMDGSLPTSASSMYTSPIPVKQNGILTAAVIKDNMILDQLKKTFNLHKAAGKKITLEIEPSKQYNKGGNGALINGSLGNDENFNDDEWLGWNGKTFNATIDLGEEKAVSSLSTRFFHRPSSWVWVAKKLTVQVSADGTNFTTVAEKQVDIPANDGAAATSVKWQTQNARYIRVTAEPLGIIPAGNTGAGDQAWLFVDELIVE